jgi:hypothetical protein
MGDFERGLIQGEAMRHQIEKTNIELLAENTKLKAALEPFAMYARKRLAQPLNSLGDSVHRIHAGSEFEAEICFSHCVAALRAIGQ